MRNLRLLLALLLFSPIAAAQQSVPVQVPPQMLPVAVQVSGLPAGCTWTAAGGTQIVITVTGCPTAPPTSGVTSVSVAGPASIAANATATFTATVKTTGTAASTVTWTATNGAMAGAVFTPKSGATTAVITATSTVDPTKFGTATLAITPVVVTPPPTGTLAIGAAVAIATPCNPCHVWPSQSATAGASGTPINVTGGQAGTVVGGPIVNPQGTWWQVKLGTVVGWTTNTNLAVTTSAPAGVTLNWTPSVSPSIANYNAYRGTTSGGPYTKIGTVSSSVSTYTDSSVTSGSKCFYVVTALGSASAYQTPESVYSNEVVATIP